MPRRGGSICSPEGLVAVQSQPFIRGGSSGAVVGEDHGPKRREVLEPLPGRNWGRPGEHGGEPPAGPPGLHG